MPLPKALRGGAGIALLAGKERRMDPNGFRIQMDPCPRAATEAREATQQEMQELGRRTPQRSPWELMPHSFEDAAGREGLRHKHMGGDEALQELP